MAKLTVAAVLLSLLLVPAAAGGAPSPFFHAEGTIAYSAPITFGGDRGFPCPELDGTTHACVLFGSVRAGSTFEIRSDSDHPMVAGVNFCFVDEAGRSVACGWSSDGYYPGWLGVPEGAVGIVVGGHSTPEVRWAFTIW